MRNGNYESLTFSICVWECTSLYGSGPAAVSNKHCVPLSGLSLLLEKKRIPQSEEVLSVTWPFHRCSCVHCMLDTLTLMVCDKVVDTGHCTYLNWIGKIYLE